MRFADIAAAHEIAKHARDGDLAAVAAHALDATVERGVATLDGVGRHGARYERGREDVLGPEDGGQCQRRRHLRAVQQRESLLGREPYRLDAGLPERLVRRHQVALHAHLADAEQRARHVRERREVARGADRTARRNAWVDALVEQRAQGFDEHQPHTREALGQRDDFHQHDETDDVVIEIFADADGMRAHEVFLQAFEFVAADAHRCQAPEARVDAVDAAAAREQFVDDLGRFRDASARVGRQENLDGLAPRLPQLGQRHELFVDRNLHHAPPRPIMGRCRPCACAQSMATS